MSVMGAPEAGQPTEPLVRMVRRAIREWTTQLMDVSGNNTLLCYRDLKAGTLDLGTADEVALTDILCGEKVRQSTIPFIKKQGRRGQKRAVRLDLNGGVGTTDIERRSLE